MIVDASLVLSAFFRDESQPGAQALIQDHIAGRIPLKAPGLLPYELANAVWQAERRGRIDSKLAGEILAAMQGLQIEIAPVAMAEMLAAARQFGVSVYDGAYLALAKKTGETLATGDSRLHRAVGGKVDWVKVVGG